MQTWPSFLASRTFLLGLTTYAKWLEDHIKKIVDCLEASDQNLDLDTFLHPLANELQVITFPPLLDDHRVFCLQTAIRNLVAQSPSINNKIFIQHHITQTWWQKIVKSYHMGLFLQIRQ